MKKTYGLYPVNVDKDFWFYPLKKTIEFVIAFPGGTRIYKVRRGKMKYVGYYKRPTLRKP